MNSDDRHPDPIPQDHQLTIAELKKQLVQYEQAFQSAAAESEDDHAIDLRQYWQVLVRRKWTIISTTLLLLLIVIVATTMMTPVFRASTVLQIERESGKVLEFESVTAEEAANARDFYQTQYELLKSRTLARRVIDTLGIRPGVADPSNPDGATGPSLLGRVRNLFGGSGDDTAPAVSADVESLFLNRLTVTPVRNSRLVRIHYDSTDPEEAAMVVNTLADEYVAMSLERRFDASTYAKEFLEDRIKQVRADLEDSERELVNYSQQRGIINQEDRLGILTDKLREMNVALVEVEAERLEAESHYQEMLGASTSNLSQMLNSPVIQNLKSQKNELESEYKELLKVFKPAYPRMQRLQERITQVDSDIESEIGQIRGGIQVQYQAKLREEAKLQESIANTQQQILDLQARSTDFQTLKREVDTNRELYDGLLQRMKEVGVAAGVSTNNISVVDRAQVPRSKYKPNLMLNVAIALALGLFLGVLLAFLFESLDDTIKTADELEKLVGKPVLGVVPRVREQKERRSSLALHAHEDPTSAFAEAYRSLRTALMFSTEHGAPKVLHVTSVSPEEGKTTTAVSTAINLAQNGASVLLVDADLRNPSLHRVFKLGNQHGLSDLLVSEQQPAQVTRPTEVDNLFVITSGRLPPSPAELLSSGKMVDLAALASKRFDYVIIDSPPLLGLADAVILADLADATMLVAAAKSTRSGALEAGIKRLRQHSRAHILGSVLTKFDLERAGFGYGYEYQYSYGPSNRRQGRQPA